MKVDEIVIVGGGSSGWMAASLLIRLFPQKTITLIEDPNTPTIGVGESTLAGINKFLQILGVEEKEFMNGSDASYKLSIKFNSFLYEGSEGFHYPFGRPFLDGTKLGLEDWFFKKALYPETPVQDFVRSYFPSSFLFENNKYNPNLNGEFDNFTPRNDVAYHFDAIKFALWLRDSYAKPKGVHHVQDNVSKINIDDSGISELILSSGKKIKADLYLDCTGFKSLLLGDALKEPFKDLSHILPNNSAWATPLQYKDKEKELQGFTNCTAIKHGWVWNTPTWSRIGTGYVFSDKFISPDDALKEFKEYLSSSQMTVKRTHQEIENLTPRLIKFKTGIHERTWVKNVVAIGLSAGFLEPLESNGLYTVHEFLFKLAKTLERGSISQWDRDVYNVSTKNMYLNFAEFIALHYALSLRTDTEYWKYYQTNSISQDMFDLNITGVIGAFDLSIRKMFTSVFDQKSGITYVSTGMEYFLLDSTTQKIGELTDGVPHKQVFSESFEKFEEKKKKWKDSANKSLSLYEYQKINIYGEGM